jgi:hypothetical protein
LLTNQTTKILVVLVECLVECLVEWAAWAAWVAWGCKNSDTQKNLKTPEKSTFLAFFFILINNEISMKFQ